MKKKLSILLAVAMCLTMALTACSKKDPPPTNTPDNSTPPTPTETITVPDNTDTPTPPDNTDNPDVPSTPDVTEPPVETVTPNPDNTGIADVQYEMDNTGLFVYFPDSWIGYWNYETEDAGEEYPVTKFYYVGEDSSRKDDVLYMHVTANEAPEDSQVLGQWGEYNVYLVWPEKAEVDEQYTLMYDDSKAENGVLSFIPPVYDVPEGSQELIDAIVNARSDEENEYLEVVADPSMDIYLQMLNLTNEDAKNFAISLSMMNVKAYTIAIVRPTDGKAETVKTAIQEYVDSVVQSYKNYLPDQLEVAENAIIKEVGDCVVLVMCENAQDVYNSIETALQ